MISKLPIHSQLHILNERRIKADIALDKMNVFYSLVYPLNEDELIDYHMDGADVEKLRDAINVLSFVVDSMNCHLETLAKKVNP